MNYYDARQLETSGRWHYTCKNDGRIWPVGYCRDHPEGHEIEAEARNCYREYLIRERTQYQDGVSATSQHKCRECQTWTTGYATVGESALYELCDDHRNEMIIRKLYPVVGQIISS